jgi:chemotaxis protein CheC
VDAGAIGGRNPGEKLESMTTETLHERQIDVLREVASIGAGHAATALSQMTGSRIDVEVPTLRVESGEDLDGILGEPSERIAAVLIHMLGDLTGRTVLVLSEGSARRLGEILLNQEPGSVIEFGEMERSVLMEVANILASAQMNSLADFLGMMLIPSVPQLAIDEVVAVRRALLGDRGVTADLAFSIETRFRVQGSETVTGQFIFIPTLASLRIMFDVLRVL